MSEPCGGLGTLAVDFRERRPTHVATSAVPRRNYIVVPEGPPPRCTPRWRQREETPPKPRRKKGSVRRGSQVAAVAAAAPPLLRKAELMEQLQASAAQIRSPLQIAPQPALLPRPPSQRQHPLPRLAPVARPASGPPPQPAGIAAATPASVPRSSHSPPRPASPAPRPVSPGLTPSDLPAPQPRWEGPRQGWFFGDGDAGVCYYRDPRYVQPADTRWLRDRGVAAAAASPLVLLLWELLKDMYVPPAADADVLTPRACTDSMLTYCAALLKCVVCQPLMPLLRHCPALRRGIDSLGSAASRAIRELWVECGQIQQRIRAAPYSLSPSREVVEKSASGEDESPLRTLLSLLREAARAAVMQPTSTPRPSPRAVPPQHRSQATRLALHNARRNKLRSVVRDASPYGALARDLPPKPAVPTATDFRQWKLRTAPVALPVLAAPDVKLSAE
eukprot:TRINITY_DN19726_c0_g1_i1.p1 TRINITY_DN19726_c0_g1~~TRINITY_DN19726_c0_g1_i1.p1  ORF type:complete len:463 (+),score=115.93 TRINITY_DN19726_c0_g1_i1:50-1390(+)